MSLWAEYKRERENVETLERENGFITYKIFKDECYIIDLYVRPDFRRTYLASNMADEVAALAKKQGCKFITGSVDTRANACTDSIKILLAYGFKLLKSEGFMIYFIKELSNG